jgi:arginyl-tRNA synthetase
MKFTVDPKIFEKWPGVAIGVLVLRGIDNTGHNGGILGLLRGEETKKKVELTGCDFGQMPEVAVWKEVYRVFGSNPRDFRSSVEALLRRVRAGNSLPQINNLVDLYNYLSIKYHLPAGAEDLDKVKGDISLTFSDGTEKGKYIGSDTVETCDKEEVIYKDEAGFICRKWNWREADRTKIDEETKNAVLVLEAMPPTTEGQLQKALDEALALIRKYSGGETEKYILSADHPFFEIDFATGGKAVGEVLETVTQEEKVSVAPKTKGVSAPPILRAKLPPDGSIAYQIITLVYSVVHGLFPDLAFRLEDVRLEHPEDERHGDYSTNIAMKTFGNLKSKSQMLNLTSPHELAQVIAKKIPLSELVEKVEVAKPGFINFWLSKDYLSSQVEGVIKEGEDYGKVAIRAGMKISVEYTDPNPFKEFHLGHLYSNAIGESISRILEANGAIVWRGDFYGDVGMHVAKSVWGMLRKMKEEKIELQDLEKRSLPERQHFLGQGYAIGVRIYEEDKQVQKEVQELNLLVYIASQEILEKNKGWKPIINYKKFLHGNEDKLPEIKKIYEAGLRWSLEYFESIYKRLGTKFDGYYPESWVGEYGIKIVEKGLAMGVLEKSEGVVVYKGEKDGLHTRVFVNKLGLPTYEAKDLGLAFAKYQDFKYDLSINVFGKEIDEYYKVVKAAMSKIEPELGKKSTHLAHGMVRLPQGKMSSRSGNVITFEWLMEEAKKGILKIMKNLKEHSDVENPDAIAEKVALGAIKYALLRSDIGKDVIFDFEKSLCFEGDSGPYLQYTHARCESVLNKIKNQKSKIKNTYQNSKIEFNDEELAVLRTVYKFPEAVSAAGENLAPNFICSFLFDLAQKYNNFYNKHLILRADNEASRDFRLALTSATAIVLRKGLNLLGIEAPERM